MNVPEKSVTTSDALIAATKDKNVQKIAVSGHIADARIDVLRRPSGGPDGSRSKNGRRKCGAFFEVLEAVRPRSSLALAHEP